MKHIPSQQEIQRFLTLNLYKHYGCGKGEGGGFRDGTGKSEHFDGCDGANPFDGTGYGRGHGLGYCENSGFDYGAGFNNDLIDGKGYGSGYNKNIQSFNDHPIYFIDELNTLIYQIRGNYAKGAILNEDLTLTPCFIARVDNCFAHGETLRDAVQDAREKALNHTPIKIRIQRFIKKYPDPDKPVPFAELFDWHHTLTGSCILGREKFVAQHQLDTNAEYSPRFFINLTKDNFGGKIIEQLAEAYNL